MPRLGSKAWFFGGLLGLEPSPRGFGRYPFTSLWGGFSYRCNETDRFEDREGLGFPTVSGAPAQPFLSVTVNGRLFVWGNDFQSGSGSW
jgi:hypothetical protein